MILQLTAPTRPKFSQLRVVLMALLCGFAFMVMATPQSLFAADADTLEDTPVSFTVVVPAGEELKYVSNTATPAGSTASVSGNTITYTPTLNYSGVGSLDYVLCIENTTNCGSPVEATIDIMAVNDDPIAIDDPQAVNVEDYTGPEDTLLQVTTVISGLLDNDTDVDLDTLTASLHVSPTYGLATVYPDGTFDYMPDPYFFGTDSFEYAADDGNGGIVTATAYVTITNVISDVLIEIPTSFTETVVYTPTSTVITVPIQLDNRHEDIAGLNFAIDYDTTCLTFNTFTLVAAQAGTFNISALNTVSTTVGNNVVTFALYDGGFPLTPMNDGHLMDVAFDYDSACGMMTLDSTDLHLEDVVPSNLDAETLGAVVPNLHSFNVIANTAANDMSRFLVNPSAPGSGKLSEGPVSGSHFATITSQETDLLDPEYTTASDSTDHTYTLNDTGCDGKINDNALVELQGTRGEEIHFLSPLPVIDFETMPQWRICIVSTDPHGATFEKRIFIGVEDSDEAPTAILIDDLFDTPNLGIIPAPGPAWVNENITNTAVITLSVVDTDAITDTGIMSHTYEILAITSTVGTVPTTTFTITNHNQIATGPACCNYEDAPGGISYDILVRATDSYDQFNNTSYTTPTLYFDDVITINITDVNEMPGGVTPTMYSISENTPVPTPLTPALTTIDDPDTDDGHLYTLVGPGPNCPPPLHNGRFTVDMNTGVISTDAFVFASGPNSGPGGIYSICVRTTDDGDPAMFKDTKVDIEIVDTNLAPIAVNDIISSSQWIAIGSDFYSVDTGSGSLTHYGPAHIDVLANDSDPEGQPIIVVGPYGTGNLSSTMKMGSIERQGGYIAYTAPTVAASPADYAGTDSFTYQVRDNQGPPNNVSAPATVEVPYVIEHAIGDCNADGLLNSNDFVMNVLEIFEFIDIDWHEIHENGDYAGSPFGCNSQMDLDINILDVICSVNTFFGNGCGSTVTASSVRAPATLALGSNLAAAEGETIQVPVVLGNSGGMVAGASFFVNIDTDSLVFDATDTDSNGIPDAVSLDIPASSRAMFDYDAASGNLMFAIFGQALPMAPLADGTIATIELQVKEGATSSQAAIEIANDSLSSQSAEALAVEATGSTVDIADPSGQSYDIELFLPISIR